MISIPRMPPLRMVLIENRNTDGRTYNLPFAPKVATLIVGDENSALQVRDIVLETSDGDLQRINELHPSYLPLQYPLLFPYGQDGYRDDIKHREETLLATSTRKRMSIREYLSYKLMYKSKEVSTLLHAGKLLQQFIVDMYTMIKSQRLFWVKTHQQDL